MLIFVIDASTLPYEKKKVSENYNSNSKGVKVELSKMFVITLMLQYTTLIIWFIFI